MKINYTTLLPYIFIPLWCTGFLISPIATSEADPLTFLLVRFGFTIIFIGIYLIYKNVEISIDARTLAFSLLSGALLHGLYIGALWFSIKRGMPAGMSSIIAGLQPIITAALAGIMLNERVTLKQWVGIFIGFIGITFVIYPKIVESIYSNFNPLLILITFSGTLGITFGTLLQKTKLGLQDIRSTTFFQFVGAFLATVPFAMILETGQFNINAKTIFALSWSVIVLSLTSISILLVLIKHGSVSKLTTLLYLVPPLTSLMTYILYNEKLTIVQITGMLITSLGVYIATRKQRIKN